MSRKHIVVTENPPEPKVNKLLWGTPLPTDRYPFMYWMWIDWGLGDDRTVIVEEESNT